MSKLDLPIWFARAHRELGIKERPGTAHHPRILEYHAATRLHAKEDEVPWCSAFLCWVFEGLDIASTRSAAARSWLSWGRPLERPLPGCVVVLARPSLDNPQSAHVALWTGVEDDDTLSLLGGNQGNAVTIKRYPKSRVLSYRWPSVD